MYGIDRLIEFENIMPALGLGFILGFLYDIVRILRLSISNGKIFVFVTDVLYIVTAVLSSYILFLAVNAGHIRAYLVITIALGAAVYSCTAGELIYSTAKKVTDKVKKVIRALLRPFQLLFTKLGKYFAKIKKFSAENLKKIQNKSKKLLKRDDEMLYNKED